MKLVQKLALAAALPLVAAGGAAAYPGSSINGEDCPSKGGVVCQIQLGANGQVDGGLMAPMTATDGAIDGDIEVAMLFSCYRINYVEIGVAGCYQIS